MVYLDILCQSGNTFAGPSSLSHTPEFGSEVFPDMDAEEGSEPASPMSDDLPDTPPVTTRSSRVVRRPGRFRDFLPAPSLCKSTLLRHLAGPQPLPRDPLPEARVSRSPTPVPVRRPVDEPFQTKPDNFGLYKWYPRKPTFDPDSSTALHDLCDPDAFKAATAAAAPASAHDKSQPTDSAYYAPFSNHASAAAFVAGSTKSSLKSGSEIQRLVQALGNSPSTDIRSDLQDFNYAREARLLDKYMSNPGTALPERNNWKCSSVKIPLPCDGVKQKEGDAHTLTINDVYHQDLVDLIEARYSTSSHLHYTPFEFLWKPTPGAPAQRLRSDMFCSDAALQADQEIQNIILPEGEEELERVVAPLILASDSSHLAQFSDASFWPIYMLYGSESKYIRSRPTTGSCDHVAYVPSVSFSH